MTRRFDTQQPDPIRSLRNSLGWMLLVQTAAMLGLVMLTLCPDALFGDSNLHGLIGIGLVGTMIGTTVFCGGRLMKIIIVRQELEGKSVNLCTPLGLYAWFLVFFPLLALVGAPTKGGWLFFVPVLFLPLYATIPLIAFCRYFDRQTLQDPESASSE